MADVGGRGRTSAASSRSISASASKSPRLGSGAIPWPAMPPAPTYQSSATDTATAKVKLATYGSDLYTPRRGDRRDGPRPLCAGTIPGVFVLRRRLTPRCELRALHRRSKYKPVTVMARSACRLEARYALPRSALTIFNVHSMSASVSPQTQQMRCPCPTELDATRTTSRQPSRVGFRRDARRLWERALKHSNGSTKLPHETSATQTKWRGCCEQR